MRNKVLFISLALMMAASLTFASCAPKAAPAPEEDVIKIGFLNCLTGPYAAGIGIPAYRGQTIAIDMCNDAGGVLGKYKIEAVIADDQSNPDVGLRETERLISVEHVDMMAQSGTSAIAIAAAGLCEKSKVFFWANLSAADALVLDKHYHYVFQAQPHGSMWGEINTQFICAHCKELGYDSPSGIRVAMIHNDRPWCTCVNTGAKEAVEKAGMQLVLYEAYDVETKDFSPLILKLKAADPDVIYHCGDVPDNSLIFRQAKELGLKFKFMVAGGCGHGCFPEIGEAIGPELVNYLTNTDPPPIQTMDLSKLAPDVAEGCREMLRRYDEQWAAKEGPPSSHAAQVFAHTWVLLNKVLPECIEKYGEINSENLMKTCREFELPEGGSPEGYGFKFLPVEDEKAGHNSAAYPLFMQYIDGEYYVVWPEAIAERDPIIPLPPESPFAK